MNGKGWALLGFGGVLIALMANSETIKSKAVDILKSIGRTFGNEGGWEAETAPRAKLDIGNYYRGIYYGTNHGVTAAFLADNFSVLQIPLIDKYAVKNLTPDQCADIFRRTEGVRMRYDELKNQAVADFIFDWMIQRPDTCVSFMETEIFGMKKGTARQRGIYTDDLLNRINATEPSALYNSLKYWRLRHLVDTNVYKSFLKGVYNRIVSFDDFPNTDGVTRVQAEAKKRAFGV
jgi:Glycosyl hydrolase 108